MFFLCVYNAASEKIIALMKNNLSFSIIPVIISITAINSNSIVILFIVYYSVSLFNIVFLCLI